MKRNLTQKLMQERKPTIQGKCRAEPQKHDVRQKGRKNVRNWAMSARERSGGHLRAHGTETGDTAPGR